MNKITITTIIAALTLLMASCSSIEDDHTLKNNVVEYTFPAEWENHEGTWLIWPHNYGVIVSEYVNMIEDVWVTMTKALHTGERVHIVAYDA